MDIVRSRPPGWVSIADVATVGSTLFGLGHGWWLYSSLVPSARVPMQFDLNGLPTWTGPPLGFLIYPAMSFLLPLSLRAACEFLLNVLLFPGCRMGVLRSVPVTEKRSAESKLIAENFLVDTQLLLALAMPVLQYFAGEVATLRAGSAPAWFVRSFVGAILASAGVSFYGIYRYG